MNENTPIEPHVGSTWGSRLRRQRARPPRRAFVASVVIHAVVVALLLVSGVVLKPDLPEFLPFQVTLISPPAQVQAPEPEPVETTTPIITEPEPKPPEPKPVTKPKETPKTVAPKPAPVEKPPEPKPAKGPDPKPVSVGGENLNIQNEGAPFPFPEYLEDVTLQLMRYFRWDGSPTLEAEVVFYIDREGRVGPGPRFVRKSGNFQFDARALEAVELAGRNRAFDPLPRDWQSDRLWISFTFKPRT